MERKQRLTRVIALTRELVASPYKLFSYGYFATKYAVAKSTLSEDISLVAQALRNFGLGEIETVAGAAGGVRYKPVYSEEANTNCLTALAQKLRDPKRILPGKMLYINDLIFTPTIAQHLGEIIMGRTRHLNPECIMAVETKGALLSVFVARAFNIPLVMARKEMLTTEGPAVSINYVTATSQRIETMSLPKSALRRGQRVLIVDDFLKGGGTAKGMQELVREMGACVVGTGFFIAASEPKEKLISDYFALLKLEGIDEQSGLINIKLAENKEEMPCN